MLKLVCWKSCGKGRTVCEQSRKRKKWMYALYKKYDGENKELDLLVLRIGDTSCGGLEIMME